MFRAPLCSSSAAHDDSVGYHIGRLVLELLLDGSLSAGRTDEFPDRRLLQPKTFCVLHNTVEHNYISPSSTVGIQLHVSALYVGHLQVVI